MKNGGNWRVYVAILVMLVIGAFVIVTVEGIRRKAQEDRPGGPVPMLQEEEPEKKASQ